MAVKFTQFKQLIPTIEYQGKPIEKTEDIETVRPKDFAFQYLNMDALELSKEKIIGNLVAVLSLRRNGSQLIKPPFKKMKNRVWRSSNFLTITLQYIGTDKKIKSKTIYIGKHIFKSHGMSRQELEFQRKLYSKVLFDSPEFDPEFVFEHGGILNPRLWDLNIAYNEQAGNHVNWKEYLQALDLDLKAKIARALNKDEIIANN